MKRATNSALLIEQLPHSVSRAPYRFLGLSVAFWAIFVAAAAVLGGGVYSIWLARTSPPAPTLPAGPPNATVLVRSSTTDMLDGNFITTTALFRTSQSPAAVISFYRVLLAKHLPQFGHFSTVAYTTDPNDTPAEALQYMPALFTSPTKSDPDAAKYVYTEYSEGDNDVAVAVDLRHPHGPTLVYQEMLTQPSSSSF